MEGTHHETDRSVILSCHPFCTDSAGDLPYAPHPPVCTSIFKNRANTLPAAQTDRSAVPSNGPCGLYPLWTLGSRPHNRVPRTESHSPKVTCQASQGLNISLVPKGPRAWVGAGLELRGLHRNHRNQRVVSSRSHPAELAWQ